MGGALAQTRSKRVLEKPNEPPLPEGHTFRSGEGSMEHTFELMDTYCTRQSDHQIEIEGQEAIKEEKGKNSTTYEEKTV
ncbi:hypothetical protein Tco_0776253 [Tanacetum coccineum]